MGSFSEMLKKTAEVDRQGREAAKLQLLKDAGITARQLVSDNWEIREEGSFGSTTVSLWQRVGMHHVVVESLARFRVVDSE